MIGYKLIINLTYMPPEGDDLVSARTRPGNAVACIGCGEAVRKILVRKLGKAISI
jgi:hypothetical protein